MATSLRNVGNSRLFWTATALACCLGCKDFNLRGDGFSESFNEAAGYERPTERTAPSFGVSTKAKEIERDFGVK